jgi:hypothetical protein
MRIVGSGTSWWTLTGLETDTWDMSIQGTLTLTQFGETEVFTTRYPPGAWFALQVSEPEGS